MLQAYAIIHIGYNKIPHHSFKLWQPAEYLLEIHSRLSSDFAHVYHRRTKLYICMS
nr:MAG TPA: hypothetical protein [Caudoviricetes sp.]